MRNNLPVNGMRDVWNSVESSRLPTDLPTDLQEALSIPRRDDEYAIGTCRLPSCRPLELERSRSNDLILYQYQAAPAKGMHRLQPRPPHSKNII
eukprot:scaffold375_cov189-Skeletonema_marinoi.AAC.11